MKWEVDLLGRIDLLEKFDDRFNSYFVSYSFSENILLDSSV